MRGSSLILLKPMTYDQALAYIASLEPRGWRLGLDRMEAFIQRAGLADAVGRGPSPKFIHVAGTNGKGSVTAFLQSLLTESGVQTGAFFSPFVVDPRERVQINRSYISREELAQATEYLLPIAESFSETEFGGISEFEFKTAVGFLQWKRSQCDWVALEVGLGGRLDATNVVTPCASVIVSIGLDHMNLLGHTHAAIAFEKAGIIKPGVGVAVGQMSHEAESVVLEVARQQNAPVWRMNRDIEVKSDGEDSWTVRTPGGTYSGLKPGLRGVIQPHNMALAIAALGIAGVNIEDDSVRRGVERATIPGRMHLIQTDGRTVLLDGAHNPDAAASLRATLETGDLPGFGPIDRIILVTNMLSGHDPEPFYEVWRGLVEEVHVVPISFHRAVPPGETALRLGRMFKNVIPHATLEAGIDSAMDSAAADDLVVVTGSFYLVGEAIKLLSPTIESSCNPE